MLLSRCSLFLLLDVVCRSNLSLHTVDTMNYLIKHLDYILQLVLHSLVFRPYLILSLCCFICSYLFCILYVFLFLFFFCLVFCLLLLAESFFFCFFQHNSSYEMSLEYRRVLFRSTPTHPPPLRATTGRTTYEIPL